MIIRYIIHAFSSQFYCRGLTGSDGLHLDQCILIEPVWSLRNTGLKRIEPNDNPQLSSYLCRVVTLELSSQFY